MEGALPAREMDVVALAKTGDRGAFAAIVEPHLPKALTAVRLIVGPTGDASDVVQDALLSSWRDLPRLRDADAFPGWFRQHVVRAAWRAARRAKRTERLDDRWVAPVDDLERSLAVRQLERSFQRLDANDRLLLTLHYHLGLADREIGELMRVPTGTVKSRLHHGLRRLRAAFEAEDRG